MFFSETLCILLLLFLLCTTKCFANVCLQEMGCEKSAVQPLPLATPVYDDQVRFVCMSDTHFNAAYFTNMLPPGDVFLHAGDFTYLGLPREVEQFNEFLGNNDCFCCFSINSGYRHNWFYLSKLSFSYLHKDQSWEFCRLVIFLLHCCIVLFITK